MAGPVSIETFTSRAEAEIAREVLEANGIESDLIADDAGKLIPALAPNRGVALVVAEEDAERAQEVLRTARSAPTTDEEALGGN